MATLSNFGEQFASKTLAKVYASAVSPAIVNRNYQGEISKPGDRVNILSFLNNILLSDYAVGSDMSSETIIDAEDVLIVEKRKYYNFSLDRLEDLFTYASDIPDSLLENARYVLETAVDQYVLEKATEAKAGSWIGVDLRVIGGINTQASIVTTATGGTVTLGFKDDITVPAPGVEQGDGTIMFGGFEACDIGKGFRLRSTYTWVSPWWKITGVTSSVSATITEWDGATSGSDFKEGFTLRGIYGGDGKLFPKENPSDLSWMLNTATNDGLGWEIQAAGVTSVSASSIYDQITLLAEKLNGQDVPLDSRHLTVPEEIVTQLKQSAETQPTGISEIYTNTVINGRFMRMGGFDIHMATGAKLSSRVGHSTGSGDFTSGNTGYFMLANHTNMITFADKWSESRIVDAENQFAKKYQGLFLYGAKVPAYARKYGAVLYGNF